MRQTLIFMCMVMLGLSIVMTGCGLGAKQKEELESLKIALERTEGERDDLKARIEIVKEARDQFEKAYLIQMLTAVKGNVSRAAERSGKDRAEFYKLLRKHTLDPWAFKGERAEKSARSIRPS